MGSILDLSGCSRQENDFRPLTVVKKGNLVAVVSPNEWEADQCGACPLLPVPSGLNWAGLPGSENLTAGDTRLRMGQARGSRGNAADVTAADGGKRVEDDLGDVTSSLISSMRR